MVDLDLATLEQILAELSNRHLPFCMLIPGNNKGLCRDMEEDIAVEMHVSHLGVRDTYDLIKESHEVMDGIQDGHIPPNLKIMGIGENGEVREIELEAEDEEDPWN